MPIDHREIGTENTHEYKNVNQAVYASIVKSQRVGRKQLAVLIDPDRLRTQSLDALIALAEQGIDFFFIGGSLLMDEKMEHCLQILRRSVPQPLVIFPGSPLQISAQADAILLLSLISGRNADLLIGQHVIAAPYLKASGLEIIPTGYMLIDGGVSTTAAYMSGTQPIPPEKIEIAVCTAMAGTMLGLKMLYLDAGSGAQRSVSPEMIQAVRAEIEVPLITGGGIRTPEKAYTNLRAGADLLVVGNVLEKDPGLLTEIAAAVRSAGV
jgi:phosphoglycerol geranylgeranyltransferase